ncbi:MAG: GNAT family N-acetyltransferase [Candidatus Woesearchaeota archaeon]
MDLSLKLSTDKKWSEVGFEIMAIERIVYSSINLDTDEKTIKKYFEDRQTIFLMAFSSASLIGYIIARPLDSYTEEYFKRDPNFGKGNALYIESITVKPENQRKGVGKKLVDELISLAKENGYRFVAGHFFDSSFNLFARKGALNINDFKDWYGSGCVAHYLSLEV